MSNVMGFETFENPFPFPQVTVILGKLVLSKAFKAFGFAGNQLSYNRL